MNEITRTSAEKSPEVLMEGLSSRINRGLDELGVPPRNNRVWGSCNFIPDAVLLCAFRDGQERGYKVRSAKYQAQSLHLKAAGLELLEEAVPEVHELDELWRSWESQKPPPLPDTATQTRINAYHERPEVRRVVDTTFGHGFSVLWIDDAPFIVDESFSQFIGPDGTFRQEASGKSSGISIDDPLARQLLEYGYAPLTDGNLQTYLRFLTTDDHPYLRHVSADLLDKTPALFFDIDDNELTGRIPPVYQASE